MDGITLAMWGGSLFASVILGTFMFVQSIMDVPRRPQFALFASTWWILALIDFLGPLRLSMAAYEFLRTCWPAPYIVSLLWLLGHSWKHILPLALGQLAVGLGVWFFIDPLMATTVAYPTALCISAIAHGRYYRLHNGYASGVLCAYSVAMAMSDSIYYTAFFLVGGTRVIVLGYGNWVVLNVLAVLFGWIHLPRELQGVSPVRLEKRQALSFFVAVILSEIGVIWGMLLVPSWPPYLYIVSTIFLVVATLLLFFNHRHRLVIYAANVSQLLEERTASLRSAQETLSRQNEIMAEKLREQERELKEKAEVIERQRRLELAAQTAGEAAHDIQNLISPILANVSQLQRENGQSDSIREVSGTIRRQVENLFDLNSQLLALARRGRVETAPIRLNDLIEDIVPRFPGKNLLFDQDEEIWIEGSWSQISRALSNLIANGFEAAPDRAEKVTVRCRIAVISGTRRCHLGFLGPGAYAKIDVEDTGPGIGDAVIEKIFTPFFSTKTGRHRSGSGLGLSIVAAVVDDHKGVLDLRTGSAGTCFTIYLPLSDNPGRAIDPSKLRGNETIIVTDDDSAILQQYGKILEDAGYTTITTQSGAETLKILQLERADLILLDFKMPHMTGFDTFFNAIHLRPGLRAVVHSSFVTAKEATRLRELGVSAILEKPASRHELLLTIRKALDE